MTHFDVKNKEISRPKNQLQDSQINGIAETIIVDIR
jgi:hypothetical protein